MTQFFKARNIQPVVIDKYTLDLEVKRTDNLAVQKQVVQHMEENVNKYGQMCYCVDIHKAIVYKKWKAHSGAIINLDLIESLHQFVSVSSDKKIKIWDFDGNGLGLISLVRPQENFWKFRYDWIDIRLSEFDEVFKQLEIIEGTTYDNAVRSIVVNNYFVKNYVVPYNKILDEERREQAMEDRMNDRIKRALDKPHYIKNGSKEEAADQKTSTNPEKYTVDIHYKNLLQLRDVNYTSATKTGAEINKKFDFYDTVFSDNNASRQQIMNEEEQNTKKDSHLRSPSYNNNFGSNRKIMTQTGASFGDRTKENKNSSSGFANNPILQKFSIIKNIYNENQQTPVMDLTEPKLLKNKIYPHQIMKNVFTIDKKMTTAGKATALPKSYNSTSTGFNQHDKAFLKADRDYNTDSSNKISNPYINELISANNKQLDRNKTEFDQTVRSAQC